MADGTPDLSDLLAVIEESPVVTLHQISSGHEPPFSLDEPVQTFNPTNTSFPVQSYFQNTGQLGQIPELGHDLPEFQPTNIEQTPMTGGINSGGSSDVGSLGSLFLSSIGCQIDPGKRDDTPFVQPVPENNIPKISTQKSRLPHQKSGHQIRNSALSQLQKKSANYMQFGNNASTDQTSVAMDTSPGELGVKAASTGNPALPFISPTDMHTNTANIQICGPHKKGQFIHPNIGGRQQPVISNPPRPLSAASNSSEHLSRPGSVPQPSPSCGSNHSGDPATPLTPQSFNAGTPQPYKPATPQSVQQQKRNTGHVDVHHHSPQVPSNTNSDNYIASRQTPVGFQTQQQSSIMSINSMNDDQVPIKDVFTSGNSPAFSNHSSDLTGGSLWSNGPAIMSPNSLFVTSSSANVASSSSRFVPFEPNFGFDFGGEAFGHPVFPGRLMPRAENPSEETLTERQSELLNSLTQNAKKPLQPAPPNVTASQALVSKPIQSGNGDHAANTNTIDIMNKANTAGSAAVEKLLGSNPYEAISPVSDYALSPTKVSLSDELTENLIFSPPKFSSHSDMTMQHHVNLASSSQDLMNDPVFMYTTANNEPKPSTVHDHMQNFQISDTLPDFIPCTSMNWTTVPSVANSVQPGLSQSHFTTSSVITQSSFSSGTNAQQKSPLDSNIWNAQSSTFTLPTIPHDITNSGSSGFPLVPNNQAVTTQESTKDSLQKYHSHVTASSTSSTRDGQPLGGVRHKFGSDTFKSKKSEFPDSSLGFEFDDDAETICLGKNPPKPIKRKPSKQGQPVQIFQRPISSTATPSDEVKEEMEKIKQLQKQQAALQKMHALKSQQNKNSNAINQALPRQLQSSVPASLISTMQHRSQTIQSKSFTESITGMNHTVESILSYSSSQLPTITSSSSATPKTAANNPVPLSKAHPSFQSVTVRSSQETALQNSLHSAYSHPQVLPVSSNSISILTSFFDATPKQSNRDKIKQNTLSYLPAPSISTTSVDHFVPVTARPTARNPQIPEIFSSPSLVSSVVTLPISVPNTQSNSASLTKSDASTSILRSKVHQSDNHPNLDWLNNESDRIMRGEDKAMSFNISNPSPVPNVTFPSTPKTNHSHHPTYKNSFLSPSNRSNPSENDVLHPKQSILPVQHLSIQNSASLLQSPINTPSVSAVKKNIQNEVKHTNFKKQRILDGAFSTTPNRPTSTVTSTTSDATASFGSSVLDKQRRYSKEHINIKPKHRVPHQLFDNNPPSSASNMHGNVKEKLDDVKEESQDCSKKSSSNTSGSGSQNEKPGDQDGNMFLLFNSLLQEASESAKKNTLNSQQETTSSEGNMIKEVKSSTAATAKSDISPKSNESLQTSKNLKQSNVAVSSQSLTNLITTVSPSLLTSQVSTVSSNDIRKLTKKNRPAAKMPFKKGYFDDTQCLASKTSSASSNLPVKSTNAVISTPSIVTTVISHSLVTSKSITTPSTKVTPAVSVHPKVSTPATTPSLAVKIPSTKTAVTSVATTTVVPKVLTSQNAPQKSVDMGGALKLRITAFRSSKGDIIHQSSVLDTPEDGTDSDRSRSKRHKKKKKKKDKKRNRKISSSEYDSSVSAKSKISADETAKLVEEAKMNEMITRELERKAQSMLKTTAEIAKISSPKDNSVGSFKSTVRKNKRAKPTTVDDVSEAKKSKRTRITKPPNKKKRPVKSDKPVTRYLPKSVVHHGADSSGSSVISKITVSLPSTYQRAPGKLPLYLSSSEGKSSSAPTIQLVARNSSHSANNDSEVKSNQPTKIMSVKISNPVTSKAFQSSILSNANVQYIVPTGKSQVRSALPKIPSTPLTVPVSVVSPLIVRSLAGGFVPLSVSSLTTASSTRPQLFSVPISHSNPISTPSKTRRDVEKDKLKNNENISCLNRSSQSTTEKQTPVLTNLLTISNAPVSEVSDTTPRVTAKVISSDESSSNNFQSVFVKLVTLPNPVETYVPPDPPVELHLDVNGNDKFQCLACDDKFLFNDSLEDHYARRSILIKVRCMHCDEDMMFLNKCKLLLHAMQHSDGMKFNNAHISPLPLSFCKPRSKEFFRNQSANSISEKRKSSVISSEDEQSSSSVKHQCPSSFLVCTECNFVGATAEALVDHFQRTTQQTSPDKKNSGSTSQATFTCDICKLVAPNQCFFLAHLRTHNRAKPLTCPECGQTFDNDSGLGNECSDDQREIDFNRHLHIQCCHLPRISAFKCRLCSLICKSAELLRRHLEVRHLQMFYKCRDCPMAFKTQENITSHQRSAHGFGVATAAAGTKVIHKCPLCDTVFTDNSSTQQLFLLQKHFEGHMNHPSIHITAYRCLFCNSIYEKKSLLRDHLKTAHDFMASVDNCGELNESGVIFEGSKESETSNKGKKRSLEIFGAKEPVVKLSRLLTSEIGGTNNPSTTSGVLGNRERMSKKLSGKASDLGTLQKNALQPLKLRLKGMNPHNSSDMTSGSMFADSDDLTVNLSTNVRSIIRDGRKVFPCGQCAKELPSARERLNHIRLKHQGIRTLYCCPHCPPGKIKFAKKISLKKHLKKIHQMEEIKKQDVRIEYIKLPIGQRLDRAALIAGNNASHEPASSSTEKGVSTIKKVRKKITGPGRKPIRQRRETIKDVEMSSPYMDKSDSEVEQILSNKIVDNTSSDTSDREEPDFSVLKFPDVYVCAKCDHKSTDRLEFQAHILEHKEDAEAYDLLNAVQQCTECGLCFASAASHSKHLFIKHKIKKINWLIKFDEKLKQARRADGSLPRRLAGEGYSSTTDSSDSHLRKFKCSVCFKRFEDDSKLRSHMRTHGLAFVKSKHSS